MSYELSIKTHKDYRDCKCVHKMVWKKKSISELIDIFNSFEGSMAKCNGLYKQPIIITCVKCAREWVLVGGTGFGNKNIITEQFRIYKDGSTKRYKTTTCKRSTLGAIVSRGYCWGFNPKDEDF